MQEKVNRVIQADCLEYLQGLPKGCVDLVLIDPPYNINHSKWDKWRSQKEYINWLGHVFLECQRVLKSNGSFYFWHNDFQQMAELQHWISQNTKFIFKSMLVWNKRFKVSKNFGFLNGFLQVENLRNYQQMSEYCLFYVLHADSNTLNNFAVLRNYFKELQEAIGLNIKSINKLLGHRKAEHAFYWNSTQWGLPTKEVYSEILKIPTKANIIKKDYAELKKDYDKERYTFNNQKTFHSIIDCEINNDKLHSCEKPQDLLQKIILTSSNENDIVLDCFAGSGSTALACKKENRNFLCCERDADYVKIAQDRLANWQQDLERQDKLLNDRGVMDFESDMKKDMKTTQNNLF